jgi:hypothetical protein
LKNKTIISYRVDIPIITIIGIGSSSSFTKGAPMVTALHTKIIILNAVDLLLNGNILSS